MPEAKNPNERIDELEAAALRALKKKRNNRPRKPIVIEFAGSPKSGKSSCIGSLDVFLRRNGFSTHVITEKASVCPIDGKFDPLFNIWTGCVSLANTIEVIDRDARKLDVIMIDRGLFDALCWFEWQRNNHFLRSEDYENFTNFFTTSRFRMMTDLVFLFEANPECSIEREYKNLLTRKEGSIMRRSVLQGYIDAANAVFAKYTPSFRHVEKFNTVGRDQNEVNYQLTQKVIDTFDNAADERIGYVEYSSISSELPKTFRYSAIRQTVEDQLSFDLRERVEDNKELVQFIPVAVVVDANTRQVLAGVKSIKTLGNDSPEVNKILLWFGGHLREEDGLSFIKHPKLEVLKQCLYREVKEEIGLDISTEDNDPECIWVRDGTKSNNHVAVVFNVTLDLQTVKIKFDENEFEKGAVSSLPVKSVEAIEQAKLKEYLTQMDSWSKSIAESIIAHHMKPTTA